MRVAVCGLKGGIGKTTTAVYLSELAAKEAPTALFDADVTPTAYMWSQQSGGLTASVSRMATTQIGPEVEKLGGMFAHFIIDCPPGHVDITRAAMAAADICVVPCAPSQKDISTLPSTLELAELVGRPLVVLLVKYRRWTLASRRAERALVDNGVPILRASVGNHTAFETDMESVPTRFYGYEDVWEELKTLYRRLQDGEG